VVKKSIARNVKGSFLALSRKEEKEHYVKLRSVESVFLLLTYLLHGAESFLRT